MTTIRDLNDALDEFVKTVQKHRWFEVASVHFDGLVGSMWGEDLHDLARKDPRIGFELKAEPDGDGIEDIYVFDATRFKDLGEAWKLIHHQSIV